jgi:tetratricopeptide (TPR) repeat protein
MKEMQSAPAQRSQPRKATTRPLRAPEIQSGRMRRLRFALIILAGLAAYAGYHAASSARAKSYLRSARQELAERHFLRANADFQVCIEYWPNDPELRFQSARALRRGALMGSFAPNWEEQALGQLRVCEHLDYPPEDIDLERMLLVAMRSDLAGVETRLLGLVTEEHPDAALILETLTPLYLTQFQVPRAYMCASQLVASEPEIPYAYYWRGVARELFNANERAMEDYRRALELDPDLGEARHRLADLLLAGQHYEEANEHIRTLLRQQPNDPVLLLSWARAIRGQGELNRPEIILEQLLEQNPNSAPALEELGKLAMARGKIQDAVGYLLSALQNSPRLAQANYSLYLCLVRLGRTEEAAPYVKRFQEIDADNQRFRKVTELIRVNSHNSSDLRAEAGTLLLRNDQVEQGLGWLKSCFQLDPYNPLAHSSLASYYEGLKQPERAAAHRRFFARGMSMTGRPSIHLF